MFNQPQTNRQQNPWAFGLQQSQQPMLPPPQLGGVPQLEGQGAGATSQMGQQQGQQQPFNPMMLLSQLLGGQQQPHPFDFAGALGAVRNDPQGDANKGYVPGSMNSQYNPFNNGFFGGQPTAPQKQSPGNFGASAMPPPVMPQKLNSSAQQNPWTSF